MVSVSSKLLVGAVAMTQVSRGPGSARKGARQSGSAPCSGNHENAKA